MARAFILEKKKKQTKKETKKERRDNLSRKRIALSDLNGFDISAF
jgi:hypothetical protein